MTYDTSFSAGSVWGSSPVQLVADHAARMPTGTVLDLGCGDGRNALYLAGLGFTVHGVDSSASALADMSERARSLGLADRVVGIEADLESFEIRERYHSMICIQSLHFLSGDAIGRLLGDMQEHTMPGGLNIVTDFVAAPPLWKEGRPWLGRGELPERYAGWEILDYSEPSRATTKLDAAGNPYLQPRTEMAARKMSPSPEATPAASRGRYFKESPAGLGRGFCRTLAAMVYAKYR